MDPGGAGISANNGDVDLENIDVNNAVAIAGFVLLLVINIASVLVALRRSGRKEGLDEARFNELSNKVSNLPCVKDPNYMMSAGELKGIVKLLSTQFETLSKNLNEVNRRLDDWIARS